MKNPMKHLNSIVCQIHPNVLLKYKIDAHGNVHAQPCELCTQERQDKANEVAKRLRLKFEAIRSKTSSRQPSVVLDTIKFGAEALCVEVENLGKKEGTTK